MKKGFTLLELIVVIVILGVLATLGFTQYGRMVEKMRSAEAKQILGNMRMLAIAYRLANGTINGISYADLNVGTASDQIPSSCRSTHYFFYGLRWAAVDPNIAMGAWRCAAGGKPPNLVPNEGAELALHSNLVTGTDEWFSYVVNY